MPDLDFHPLANAFPCLAPEALEELAGDIETHGQLEPIVLFEGQILDGRQRWLACRMAGVEPRVIDWQGDGTPVEWVISKNLRRRHLNESQRAMVAARLANLAWGRNKREGQICHSVRDVTNAEAASMLNISPRSVRYARKLHSSATPELQAAVDAGEVSLSDALGAVELPPDAQREALAAVRAGEARTLCAAASQQTGEPEASATGCVGTEPKPEAGADPEADASGSPCMKARTAASASRPTVGESCEAFARELAKLVRRLDEIAEARGGDDEFTRLARRGLSIVKQAMTRMKGRPRRAGR